MKLAIISDYSELEKLYDKYVVPYGTPITGKQLLDSFCTLDSYTSFGVYKEGKLIAFLDGYKLTDKVFKLGNVYKGSATARDILKLYKYFEGYLIEAGYIGWKSESTKGTQGIVEKLGAIKWEQQF